VTWQGAGGYRPLREVGPATDDAYQVVHPSPRFSKANILSGVVASRETDGALSRRDDSARVCALFAARSC
jgi:hypothetical protein